MIHCPTVNPLQFLEAAIPEQALHVVLEPGFLAATAGVDDPAVQFIEKIKTADVGFLAVTLEGAGLFNLTTAEKSGRDETLQRLTLAIQWLSALPCPTCLIVPADRPTTDHPVASYEDAFNLSFFAVGRLAIQAEPYGVTLAIENPAAGLFLSPLEFRDFIDQINSPSVGVCFNPAHAAALDDPADWFALLNNRVRVIRVPENPAQSGNREPADFPAWLAENPAPVPLILNQHPLSSLPPFGKQ